MMTSRLLLLSVAATLCRSPWARWPRSSRAMTPETRQKLLINLHRLSRKATKKTRKTMPMHYLTRKAPQKSCSTHVRPSRTTQGTPTRISEMSWMATLWKPVRGSSFKRGKLIMKRWMKMGSAKRKIRQKRKRKSATRRKRRIREGPIPSVR